MRKSRLLALTGIIFLAVTLGLLVTPAFSGVSVPVERTLYRTETEFNETDRNHRMICLCGLNNFNDLSVWNRVANRGASSSNFTSDEIEFLQGLYLNNSARCIDYYIDLTTKEVITFGVDSSRYDEMSDEEREVAQTHHAWGRFDNYFPDVHSESLTQTQEIVNLGNNVYEMVTTQTYNYHNETFQLVGVWCESPIVLDLDNNNTIDTAANKWLPHDPKFYTHFAKFFDIDGDMKEDFTEWMSADPSDGLLVMPEDGKVETALQLFGTAGGYMDGYEKLSIVCDTDKNGWVEGQELEGLALWIDKNNNARCEEDELHSLQDFNVKKIATDHDNFKSTFVTSDGQVRTTWDWWPSVAEIRKFR
ncbi:MAG: hypothetical protein ACLFQV_02805 [Vulcanimicrobiota bacterium]